MVSPGDCAGMAASEVVPDHTWPDACEYDPHATVPEWGQCGGKDYWGPDDCGKGFECKVINDSYHQCVREPIAPDSRDYFMPWAQCGGKGYHVPSGKKCPYRQQCYAKNPYYWQCIPCPHSTW